jgi:hypothetical protein
MGCWSEPVTESVSPDWNDEILSGVTEFIAVYPTDASAVHVRASFHPPDAETLLEL